MLKLKQAATFNFLSIGLMTLGTLALLSEQAQADELELKNGTVYRNVRVVLQSGFINLVFKSGEIIAIRKSKARRLKRRPVAWKTAFPQAEFDRLMQERIARLHKQIKEQEATRNALEETYRLKALLRSTAVPGWGQYYKGEHLKSSLFFGGFVLGIAGYLSSDAYFARSRASYADANSSILTPYFNTGLRPIVQPFTAWQWSRSKAELNNMDSARSVSAASLMVVFGIYIYNLIDAYFLGSTEKLKSVDQAVGWKWNLQPTRAALARVRQPSGNARPNDGLHFRWELSF